jgi:hypothetical protein
MNSIAIVAIVAMFLAYLVHEPSLKFHAPQEVILYIDPPPIVGFPPPLPYRNPHRG